MKFSDIISKNPMAWLLRKTFIEPFTNTFGKGGLFDSLVKGYSGSGLTPAQQEANQFSHDEAVEAFNRETEFWQQNQSIDAQVAAYKRNGLNTALMFDNGASQPSVSVGSGPSSVSPSPSTNLGSLVSTMMDFVLQKEKLGIDKFDAETRRKEANTHADTGAAQVNYFEQQAKYIGELIDTQPVQRALLRSNISRNDAETAYTKLQTDFFSATEEQRKTFLYWQAEYQKALTARTNQETSHVYQSIEESKARQRYYNSMSDLTDENYFRACFELGLDRQYLPEARSFENQILRHTSSIKFTESLMKINQNELLEIEKRYLSNRADMSDIDKEFHKRFLQTRTILGIEGVVYGARRIQSTEIGNLNSAYDLFSPLPSLSHQNPVDNSLVPFEIVYGNY